jgi:hypothetical protein
MQFASDLEELVAMGLNDLEAQNVIRISPRGMVMDVVEYAVLDSRVRGEFRKSSRNGLLIFVCGVLGQRKSEHPMLLRDIEEAMADRVSPLPEMAFASEAVFYRFLNGIRACLLSESFKRGCVHLIKDEELEPTRQIG